MKLFLLITSIFILHTICFGQAKLNETAGVSDSLKITETTKASINELKQILINTNLIDPFTSHVNQEVQKIVGDYFILDTESHSLKLNPFSSYDKAKQNLLDAIRNLPKFQEAGEMGLLGEIFLYVNAAAAGYAIYEHLRKYKGD